MQTQTSFAARPWQSRKLRDRVWISGVLLWVSVGSLVFMYPLLWMLSTSLKTNE